MVMLNSDLIIDHNDGIAVILKSPCCNHENIRLNDVDGKVYFQCKQCKKNYGIDIAFQEALTTVNIKMTMAIGG